MANLANHGSITGKLAADPIAFTNADGSKKVFVTVYAQRNYRSRDGQRQADRISLETFVAATTDGLGVFDHMHRGDLVQLGFTMRSDEYPHPTTGEIIYKQYLRIESANLLDSVTTVNARLARRLDAAQKAPQVVEEPNPEPVATKARTTRQKAPAQPA